MYRGRAHLDEHIAWTGQRYPDLGRLEQDRGSDQDPLGDSCSFDGSGQDPPQELGFQETENVGVDHVEQDDDPQR